MKIVVINGVSYKGATYRMKDMFLESLGSEHDIIEYNLPTDSPNFCTGCKVCFFKDISACPHSKYTNAIWDSIVESDLIVFTSPVYVMRATGQVKALLDHYGSKWMAHSPQKELFMKKAVIITNAAGRGMNSVIKDIGVSLDFWGVAKRYSIKKALFYTDWDKTSEKTKINIKKQCTKIAKKLNMPINKPRFKIRFLFGIMRIAQKMINKKLLKDGEETTSDYSYWQEMGWLDGGKPWKK